MSVRTMFVCAALAVCTLGYAHPVCASVSASSGVSGENPTGVYYPGGSIYVQEMANGTAIVEVYNGSGSGYYTRTVSYSDSLMGSGGNQGYGEGSIEEPAHAALALDGWTGTGSTRELTEGDVGLQSGWRWGTARAYANDGSGVYDAPSSDDTPYTYEVRGWLMLIPETEVPDVLAPEEVSK